MVIKPTEVVNHIEEGQCRIVSKCLEAEQHRTRITHLEAQDARIHRNIPRPIHIRCYLLASQSAADWDLNQEKPNSQEINGHTKYLHWIGCISRHNL